MNDELRDLTEMLTREIDAKSFRERRSVDNEPYGQATTRSKIFTIYQRPEAPREN